MAGRKIAELEVGERVVGTWAARNKSLASFRSKPGQYLSFTLADATGNISARMWDNAEEAAKLFSDGDAVTARGVVEEYRGQKQMVIERLKKADPDELAGLELVPTTGHDLEQLQGRLLEAIESVDDPHLSALLGHIFCDEEFVERFCKAPGAKALHHSHLGGLAEHTVGVIEIVETVARVHPELDRDILITGALLHDLGKIVELECNTSIEYTDQGRLVGHTVLTDRMVNAAIEQVDGFPEELANRLTHLLLSHHGQHDYGAPVLPMTAEACALHYADNLDAHVQYFNQVIAGGADAQTQWSDYQRLFERYIYVGSRRVAPGEKSPLVPNEEGSAPGPTPGQVRQGEGGADTPGRDRSDEAEGNGGEAPGRLFDQ